MATNPQEVPELEVEQRDLGTQLELDLGSLDKNYIYRWCYKSPLKIARKRAKGYEIVDPADEPGIKNIFGDAPEEADGTYTWGDVVLMRVKKTIHKSRRHAIKKRTDRKLRGPERKFKKEAEVTGRERGLDIEVITDKE